MSIMHPTEYIDAHVINIWAAILDNLERKRSEGPPRGFFALVDVIVIIYLFLFTNTNDETPTDTIEKMQSTLDILINTGKIRRGKVH